SDAAVSKLYAGTLQVPDFPTRRSSDLVTDQNEGQNQPPTITSNGGGNTAAVSVAENTTAVTTVTATDPDAGQTFSYSVIGGADDSKFKLYAPAGAVGCSAGHTFAAPSGTA